MNLRNVARDGIDYNIGLDIGTASVGWAVTDADGNLLHFKKKPTWGSRLFPQAMPASEARVHRGQRRRYDRRRQRLNLLQELFCDEMESVDSEFFIRLRQARLLPEDRDEEHRDYRWPLFNGADFTEKDYYEKFPTIYHLRTWLMEADEKADIRLIYLAFHNIVKTRGNFLHQENPGLSAKNANMEASVDRLCDALKAWCDEQEIDCDPKSEQLRKVLENNALHRAEKREQAMPFLGLGTEGKQRAKEIAGAVLGYKADFGKVFGIEAENAKFDFDNDEAVETFYSECPDEGVELYEALQAAYSAHVLAGILKGANGQTISYCKVGEYERYGADLKLLKQLVREYAPAEYDKFFRGEHYNDPRWAKDYDPSKVKGYTLYNLGTSKLNYEAFAKETKNLFSGTKAEDDLRYQQMMDSFEEGTFLRRLKTSDNGSIPYQLHLEEMQAIIRNQGKHYPFLLEEQEKLESLVTFRIPYYVGPLTTKNARRKGDQADGELRFAWSERIAGQEATPIRPWNWEEVIDKDKSAENFIRRMTGTCTYLQGEPVLPRCSLIYEKFCVLNELNGSRWTQDGDDEHRFSAEDRLDIFEELFKHGSVTYKKVEDWLVRNNRLNPHVRGGQGETKFESKLSSHIFFCKVLGVDDIDESLEPMVEELILWNTLFEDRDILRDKIKRAYGDRLTDEQIRAICKKRFTGWGRLSKRLLCELKAETANGPMSIMDILIEGNPEGKRVGSAMILMEILHDDHFGFDKLIDEFNLAKAKGQGGLALDELPGSPALRRGVNQAMRIVEEIVGIAGKPPANIFIEVTRDEDKKKKGKRTTRRYDGLKEALEALEAEGAHTLAELNGLSADQLNDALSLYFMQNAKCMYCGEPLDIHHAMSGDHAYQIDHIIPRSYVKDDSFENRVLVHAGCNQRKADDLLIDPAIQRRMRDHWRALHDAGLIGDKKFNNLRRDRITDKQMQGFINRQLVETSQIVKFVRLMLEDAYPETRVESIKASLSHQLREEQGFVKCREANNFHHAHDALLAAEIGRFIQLRHASLFDNPIGATHAMKEFIRSRSEYYRATHRMPGSATFVIGSFLTSGFDKETGEVYKDAWDAETECDKIRRYLNYKQCYISRMPEITSGAFWEATIYSPKGRPKKKPTLRVKKGLDVDRYGGFSGNQFAYFFVYKAKKRGRCVFEFAQLPISVANSVNKGLDVLREYARADALEKGLEFVEVSRKMICKYQLIEMGNERFYITGKKVMRSATELAFSTGEYALLAELFADGAVRDDDVLELFDSVVSRLESLAPKLCSQMKLRSLRAGYAQSDEQSRSAVLRDVVTIASAQTDMINLTAIGGVKCAGYMQPTYSKELSNGTITFIDQSVTGMFEKRQKLEL
ncbi:MAG: type II CRISPR RNA-guided endonuclease Cas9 [Coriobacteriaceae bacterium]|nr:type II CRISPR RNA-guided endonuclease Cas9 [Coriobacteriaceae bacterium]